MLTLRSSSKSFILTIVVAFVFVLSASSSAAASNRAATKPLIVLAGASGKTGREILGAATRSGWRVRALTSDIARARRELRSFYRLAEWQPVDLTDAAAASSALSGADFVVSALGAHGFKDGDIPERVDFLANSRLIDAAVSAKVKHFVLITSATAGTQADQTKSTALMNVRFWKTRAEEQLRASGLDYTIIGPGGLTLEPARRQGLIAIAREEYLSTDVSRADVARVALDALTNPQARNKSFALVNRRDAAVDAWRGQLATLPPDRPTADADAAIGQLSWMAGHWVQQTERGATTDEVWLGPAGGLMLGMNRHVPASGHGFYENIRIETRAGGGIVFVGAPQGQAPTDFKLTRIAADRVSFFNLNHDFPQGIQYWREGEELLARVDGVDNGRLRSLEYRFRRFVPRRAPP